MHRKNAKMIKHYVRVGLALVALIVLCQCKRTDRIDVDEDGVITASEILKRLPLKFKDKMRLKYYIEDNQELKGKLSASVLAKYRDAILQAADISLTDCYGRGAGVIFFHSGRLGDIYRIDNAFYCSEARINICYFIFSDNEKALLGANELFNGRSQSPHTSDVNRSVSGHRYGSVWVIPADRASIEYVHRQFYAGILISGKGKAEMLDTIALKAVQKIDAANIQTASR